MMNFVIYKELTLFLMYFLDSERSEECIVCTMMFIIFIFLFCTDFRPVGVLRFSPNISHSIANYI